MITKLLRILLTSATVWLGVIAATTVLPVPAAGALTIWPFGVHAHVSRSTGLWMITNHKNVQVGVKYRVKVKGSDTWQMHSATIPANSDRLLGYDSRTYRMQVVSHTP